MIINFDTFVYTNDDTCDDTNDIYDELNLKKFRTYHLSCFKYKSGWIWYNVKLKNVKNF